MNYVESNMDFSPLSEASNFFYVEKSKFYQKLKSQRLRSVEFLYTYEQEKGSYLVFLEAKETAPDSSVSMRDISLLKSMKLVVYYEEIYEKLHHTLNMLLSKELGNTVDECQEWPIAITANYIKNNQLLFILVIKETEPAWARAVKTALEDKLRPLMGLWQLKIMVMSGETALAKGLVSAVLA